jgi:hypothetical protein
VPPHRPRLTLAQILAWADEHRRRTGEWPGTTSGPVAGVPGESWRAVGEALRQGLRGLPGGDSLARLLRRERGMQERRGVNKLDPAGRRRAVAMRARGLTITEIGKRLGVSRQWVSQLVRKAETEGKHP